MTLDDALLYLETTARVSCPQITCEQAGEIAGLLRDLSDQHQVDIAEMVSWKIHAQALHERDEARAKLREVERDRRAEIDCGQPDVCAKPPGCQKHWAFKASGLVRERDEARDQIDTGFSLYETTVDNLVCEREDRELDCQIACGFAWDAGREMARLDDKAHKFDAELYKAREYINQQARVMAVEIMGEDFDADDYAKPGKR